MARSYRHIEKYEKEIFELREKGLTNREVENKLGFTREQIRGFIKRYNNKQRRIRDLYDNSIVAYKTATQQTINLVLNTVKAAKRKEKVTAELQLHSDQGFQYTSHAYCCFFHKTVMNTPTINKHTEYHQAFCVLLLYSS